jgi:hypothetical protein
VSLRFQATIRYWKAELKGGLAVADVPSELVVPLGGLKQMKVKGTINGAVYQSNVMPAGSGRLTLSVSKKMMKDASVGVGDLARFEIERRE